MAFEGILVFYMCINDVMTVPVLMALHNQKGHVVPHFHHLDLRNIMVPLPMPLASCDADTGTIGIT